MVRDEVVADSGDCEKAVGNVAIATTAARMEVTKGGYFMPQPQRPPRRSVGVS